jgi:hypothetical protein
MDLIRSYHPVRLGQVVELSRAVPADEADPRSVFPLPALSRVRDIFGIARVINVGQV